ncbi:hypothetical protein [Hymenobacter psychrophilus]|nr:hypothetical protein [Hymenobacter psychrophilus]
MEGNEKGKVDKGKTKEWSRTEKSKRSKNEKADGVQKYYISSTQVLLIDEKENHKATVTDDKIVLAGECEYAIEYILTAQREILSSDGKTKTAQAIIETNAEEGFIKFTDEKVWVNPLLSEDHEDEGVYYYTLTNRQTLTFRFSEWVVSAMTLPLKYRFGGKNHYQGLNNVDSTKSFRQDFTTAININLFVGHTLRASTSYHYREQVGSITTTQKLMFGVLLGASTVTLDKSNTNAARRPLTGDTKLNKGLATTGLGFTYSVNKLNAGVFGGFDWAVGSSATKWNYNHRPWLGLAIGYSLFPFSM